MNRCAAITGSKSRCAFDATLRCDGIPVCAPHAALFDEYRAVLGAKAARVRITLGRHGLSSGGIAKVLKAHGYIEVETPA